METQKLVLFALSGSYKTIYTVKSIYSLKCETLLSDFNKICFFSTEFGRSPQYQISQKFVQWNPGWYMRTERRRDGRAVSYDEAKSILRCLCEHALTLILLTWRIWWAPNNASRWQMGFTSAFKGLKKRLGGWDTITEGSMYRRRHLRWFAFIPHSFQTTV